MRQQLSNFNGHLCRQPRKHILEIAIRAMPVHACRLNQAHDCRSPFSAAQRPCEEPVFASKRPWPNLVFRPIVVYGYGPVIEVARQRCPAFQAVIECSADGRAFGHQISLGEHPGMKCVDDRRCFFLPYSLPDTRFQLAYLSFNFIKGSDVVQRFFGNIAFVGRVQIKEFP